MKILDFKFIKYLHNILEVIYFFFLSFNYNRINKIQNVFVGMKMEIAFKLKIFLVLRNSYRIKQIVKIFNNFKIKLNFFNFSN